MLVGERQVQRASAPLAARRCARVDLVRDPTPRNQGELIWRLGLLFGAVNLLLLAIGLAATNPRRATNWNLLFALLGFVVYYNLINLSQAWVAGGRSALGPAMAGARRRTVLALSLIWWRDPALLWWRGRARGPDEPHAARGARSARATAAGRGA